MSLCAIDGCDSPSRARGWCPRHYNRWYRHGDPLHAPFSHDVAERVASYIDKTSGSCWLWLGFIAIKGYGQAWAHGRLQPAHRVVYELEVGPIPEGLELDHLCRVRRCVNPEHLEPVTRRVNLRRALAHDSAVERLKALHPEAFARILQEEQHKRGLETVR